MAVFLAIFAGNVNAATFNEKCPDLATCARVVGAMLGQKYVFDASLQGKTLATPNVELTKDNAELLFTNALHMEGYSRVPLGQPGSFQIMRQRDARDSAIPLVKADKTHPPELPQSWDMMTLLYRASHPEVVDQIARLSRSFMPANARIIPSELSGTLLVTDSAPNLKKLYEIIQQDDQKPSAEMKRRWDEWERMRVKDAMSHPHEQAQSRPAPPAPGTKHD